MNRMKYLFFIQVCFLGSALSALPMAIKTSPKNPFLETIKKAASFSDYYRELSKINTYSSLEYALKDKTKTEKFCDEAIDSIQKERAHYAQKVALGGTLAATGLYLAHKTGVFTQAGNFMRSCFGARLGAYGTTTSKIVAAGIGISALVYTGKELFYAKKTVDTLRDFKNNIPAFKTL